jgi:hypothetical protein
MSCLIITPEIEKLTSEFPGEINDSIKTLVSLWQEKNGKSMEEYPSESELEEFIKEIRKNSTEEIGDTNDSTEDNIKQNSDKALSVPELTSIEKQRKVDLDFDPRIRRDRVTLISRLFTIKLDEIEREEVKNLVKRISEATGGTKTQLQQSLNTFSRLTVIKSVTPREVFNRVLEHFSSYVNDTMENKIQAELDIINSSKGADKYSEEQKLAAAKKRATYKDIEYRKIIDNFDALAEETCPILATTEGIKIDIDYVSNYTPTPSQENEDGESVIEELNDLLNKEESIKDGWMAKFKEVSSHESLSQVVRAVIREIPKLDYRGLREKDDLGNYKFLEPDYVHAVLIDKLRNMVDSTDMIPMLQELSKTKPWVKQLIIKLQNDDALFSKFYQDFRKDFLSYWVQNKKLLPDGSYKIETISINTPEGVYYLLNSWRDNYESGTLLDSDSIYDANGELNIDNAEKGLKWVESLTNRFNNKSTEVRIDLLEDERIWKSILKVLNMIGIDANPAILKSALTNIKSSENIKVTDPIILLLQNLHIIYKGVKEGEATSDKKDTKEESKRKDLINTFGSAYNGIALMLTEVTEDAIESSVSQTIGGKTKTFYGHVKPSYLGKLIKQLKNAYDNPEKFKAFIESEYKQYEWFFKNGEWRHDWLEQLESSSEMRKGLDHKVLLSHDKIDYTNWDSLDYTITLLAEYWGVPDTNSKIQWAWYHVPIMSDAPSAEFIKFRRYRDNQERDADGNFRSYQDIILDKLCDIVSQEYDRINLVIERDAALQNGDTSIEPIANFDVSRDKDGKILNKGGAEFKFLPALNNIKYEDGETFAQKLNNLAKSKNTNSTEFKEFVRGTLRNIMDTGFEEAYEEWVNLGLLEETSSGKCMNIPYYGPSKNNASIASTLNKIKDILKDSFTSEMESLLTSFSENSAINDITANKVFAKIKEAIENKVSEGILTSADAKSLLGKLKIKNNAKDALREYYWNSKLATSQIIQLTTTDLAYYKNLEDFQKRFKEVHSPALKLNTEAIYNGEKIGRKWERTILIKDSVIKSAMIDDLKEVLEVKIAKDELKRDDAEAIIEAYKEVNVADAQAYRSLSSYRAILGMAGEWTDDMQRAFENFKKGTWDISDFNIIWQPKKPFVYTQVAKYSGIENDSDLKVPVQHKNSEFLLLATHSIVSGPLGKSSKLRAINDFMENNNIDVVQFESTTKVGKQHPIDLSDVDSYDDVINRLKEECFPNGIENPNVVHKVSYEDYGWQTETPEHFIDTTALVGTQIRKLITADIDDDARIEISRIKKTKEEFLDLYNEINVENILESFKEVQSIFSSPKEVEKVLLDEMRGNDRYGPEMVKACTLNKEGKFNIPLYDPIISQKVQSLLNSIIKKRVTKQKIKGGALIQTTGYGLTDELNIIYEGEGKDKRVKYFECYLPAYSKQFFEQFMEEGSHTLDVNKLPDELRQLIGYRIPTEDKYSMAPLYIKGFLPMQSGSCIMLPAEITTIAGSDFDIDKMYIMLPEFDFKEVFNKKQFLKDFKDKFKPSVDYNYLDSTYAEIVNGKRAFSEGTIDMDMYDFYSENKDKYTIKKLVKVEYDYSKPAKEQSRRARNNALIDMMWGVLTNPDTVSKLLKPGSFAYQKKAARIVDILESSTKSKLAKMLQCRENDIIDSLMSLGADTLDKLAKTSKKRLDPLSPITQIYFHQQNMTGAKLIGIYANHNANHALMQHTELELTSNGDFMLNGKTLTSLHKMQNKNKEFVSNNNAGFLSASVDNAKDPVLASLNQNTFTADATMLLSRLGYNPIEIGLLMRQPIIMEITKTYFRESRKGKSKTAIIKEVISKYSKLARENNSLSYDNFRKNTFKLNELANSIMIAKEMKHIKSASDTSDFSKVTFYKDQVAVGYLFQRIMKSAEALGKLTQATRADTANGGAGPTIADTKIKIQKVQDFLEKVTFSKKPIFSGAYVIRDNIKADLSEDALREELLNSPLPFLQAFYTLGVRQTENVLKEYFPHYTDSFDRVIDTIRKMTSREQLDVKTMNSVYNDILAYLMSGIEFFGGNENISAFEKREYFINKFPREFKKIVENNPDITELEFIKRLKVINANSSNPVETLVFKNVGSLSPTLRERYVRDWASLLHMKNPEGPKLALNLFRYSFFRNGLVFGPSSFIHLAPTDLRMVIPGYIETLERILKGVDSIEDEFVYQYIYNHLDNRQLVPEIPEDSSVSFLTEDNSIKDTVIFNITDTSSYADMKVVRRTEEIDGNEIYEFFDFIAKREKGEYIYYILDNASEHLAQYKRIQPLGFKNSFIEYEYGKTVFEMSTAIKKKNKKLSDEELAMRAGLVSEPLVMDDDTITAAERFSESMTKDSLNKAFEIMYGEKLNPIPDSSFDINNIQPNEDFLDANNQSICGNVK